MTARTAIRRPISTPVRTGPGPLVLAAVDLRSCGCGQALDAWDTGHCPRCGVTLAPPRRAEAS